MESGSFKWVMVAAGGVMGCIAMGALFSLPVLLTDVQQSTDWSRAGISAAMTISFITMAIVGLPWGMAADRFGPRPVVLAGTVILTLSLVLSALAPSLLAFQIAYGVIGGGAIGAFLAPMIAAVAGWFTTRRGLAVSLVSAGIGVAPLTMSPLVAQLIQHYDWRTVMGILAAIVLVTILPLVFIIRRPPVEAPGMGPAEAELADMTAGQALRSPQFLVLLATNFFCCATHAGPILHTVSYAQLCGISLVAAVSIYSLEGFSGLFGRIGFGLLSDRFGAHRVLVIGLLAQAIGALAYYFVRDLWAFYTVAVFFGFIYAGIMPLYSVLIRDNFPPAIMATIMGGAGVGGALGMALGPVLGGWIFDRTGSYGGLYLASFGFGVTACLICLTFRPRTLAAQPA